VTFIGFAAGTIARLLMPGPNTPRGFVVTTLLGVAGAFLATAVGVETGILGPRQFSGIIGASIGAIIILYVWHRLVSAGLIRDHGLENRP
jgi:uncharacterized membrane protein YeaQ/YmgE (transglycosylase-associated protein family)